MRNQHFNVGDLVHVPSSSYRFKKEAMQLDFFSDIDITKKPMIGLFVKWVSPNQCIVSFPDGNWFISLNSVYEYKEKQSA